MKFFFIASFLISIIFCSCTSSEELADAQYAEKVKKRRDFDESNLKFPPMKDYSLELMAISRDRTFDAGDPNVKMRFSLRNSGEKKLIIREWILNEADNLRFYYKAAEGDSVPEFDAKTWKLYTPAVKKPMKHYPLELLPDVKTFIEAPLPFLTELEPGRKYYIVAEMNLSSLDLRSQPFFITLK